MRKKRKIISVVLNWNGKYDTSACVDSLKNIKDDNFKHEIVVVDNDSKDRSVEFLSKKFPSLKILKNVSNLGFAGGNNRGINYALKNGADYIFILNNDTTVAPDIFKFLLSACRDEKAGIVGPKIYFSPGREFHKNRYKVSERGKVIWFAGGLIDWANVIGSHRGVDEVDTGQYDNASPPDFMSGCAMFIPREIFEKVGLFDENYFLYLEDADLSHRVRKKGFKLIFEPKSIVWHKNAASQGGSGSKLQDYYITRNRLYFGLKYVPVRAKIALLREAFSIFLTTKRSAILDFFFGRMGKGSFV